MSPEVRAALDVELAQVERVMDAPTGDLGYGTDIRCVVDIDERMDDVSGRRALAEWCLHAIDCPRGELPDDGDYGVSVLDQLNAPMTDAEMRGLEGSIKKQLERDDRVTLAVVRVVPSLVSLDVELVVTPADGTGPFRLVAAIGDAGFFVKELGE